ncbi:MAG TPA: MaoC/PaaZ C-terminal domain-containing protein [Nevskiaceae bacterium]|nr:MaoC/PaaZ C-terminal domain-containing protein [Nevskiaceae bacterium]
MKSDTCDTSTTGDDGRVYGAQLHAGIEYPLGEFHVTEQNALDFALQWDPQDFHTDLAAAHNGAYGGLIISGIQTLAIYQRLAVIAVFSKWRVVAGRGLRNVVFLRPVRPDDTLSGRMKVDEVQNDARGRTLALLTTELANQHGKPVIRIEAGVYLRTHPRG